MIFHNEEAAVGESPPDRWTLIRDVAVLQVKLLVDSARDLLLVPVSLIVGIACLLGAGNTTGSEFYRLLHLGRRSERWINLFGAADRLPDAALGDADFPQGDIDSLVTRVESFIAEEYARGGVTRQARDSVDRVLDSLSRRGRKRDRQD